MGRGHRRKGGETGILFISNSLKLLQKLKVNFRQGTAYIIGCDRVCVCVFMPSLVSPRQDAECEGSGTDRGHGPPLSLAQKPSPCLGH